MKFHVETQLASCWSAEYCWASHHWHSRDETMGRNASDGRQSAMEAWGERHLHVYKGLSFADGSREPCDALDGDHIDLVGRIASRSRGSHTHRFSSVRLVYVRWSRLQSMAFNSHDLVDVDIDVLPSNSFCHSLHMCRESSFPGLFDCVSFCEVFHECHLHCPWLRRCRPRLSLSMYSLGLASVL